MKPHQVHARMARSTRVTVLIVIVALVSVMFPTATWATDQNDNLRPVRTIAQGNCTYVVRPGDTLTAIAVRYRTTIQHLAMLNGIPCPNCIYAGSVLRVPCPYPPPPPPSPICAYHRVQPGEGLYRIALHYGVSWPAIAAANYIHNPNLIFAGTQLAIPCGRWGSRPAPSEAFNQLANELKQSGQVGQVDARLREIGLIPADKSVLDLVAPQRAAGWNPKQGSSACAQSASSPYQILAAPVISNSLPASNSTYLIGAMVLPACRLNDVLDPGFALSPTSQTEPIIYAMVVVTSPLSYEQQPSTLTYQHQQLQQQPTYVQAATQTPVLHLVAPANDLDPRAIPGHTDCLCQLDYKCGCRRSVPAPVVTLGSIGFDWDGISWWWP